MHSFSAMTKVEKENNKNTSPRTAPAMSCSRLKIIESVVSKTLLSFSMWWDTPWPLVGFTTCHPKV